ncbi:hypothetical protein CPT_Mater221 [Bacillus phage Mater]|uniref:Uncharacterized protein n=1 Tax=Bacillus phage Mater TaxID=1540090 RepID=A0A0A0RUW6_9CAUD|nr:hypothetical protein CPT_Mater221 [Bacillus phage Mater]AIW03378.1 hypothetical protein CPT_Mater221 [Bacillus phage Mater]
MTTILLIVGIYLFIGIALTIYGVVNEPMIMAIPPLLILIVLLWPYFLLRSLLE